MVMLMRRFGVSLTQNLAQQKGRRLRMLRALSGLSRQEFFEKIGISASTMDTWESGRVELAQRSAERVCEAFKKVGVCCSAEWILTGSGLPPRIMDTLERTITDAARCFGVDVPSHFGGIVIFAAIARTSRIARIPRILRKSSESPKSFCPSKFQ